MTQHPLEPLRPGELDQVVDVLRRHDAFPASARFRAIALHEPSREAVRRFEASGIAHPRRAEVSLFDIGAQRAIEAVVDLRSQEVLAWEPLTGDRQPGLFPEEQEIAAHAARGDRRWRAAMARRGVEDLAAVTFETGPGGRFGCADDGTRRIGRTLTFLRPEGTLNHYAHPVQGLLVLVDLGSGDVLDVIDEGAVPIPDASGDFHRSAPGAAPRTDLRPISITQPDGPSFVVRDGEVRWQGWRVRVSVHPIDGLVLHRLSREQDGEVRPVLHRAGLAEMVVPYGDPSANQYWRNAFDATEGGIGRKTQSLALGCDCIGEIHYLDAAVVDPDGSARHIPNAVCIHEEDHNVSWKHVYAAAGMSEVRRSRRLVISSWATLGNYDYGFYWYLYTEGRIELEVKLTGIVYTGAVTPGEQPEHGELIGSGLYAPNHQHIFCVRLDCEVDGPRNTVHEVDVVPDPPGERNRHAVAFRARRTAIARESQGMRRCAAEQARTWLVSSAHRRNAVGRPTGFTLVPRPGATLLAGDDAFVARVAPFARHHLWVTAADAGRRHPAGEYPAWGDEGIDAWVRKDRELVERELTLWHCFTATHVPRPEDWPVMPVEHAGFELKPTGFFDRNPALDLPPGSPSCQAG